MEYNHSKISFFLLLVLIFGFTLPSIVQAVRGEGTATIDGGANVNVAQGTSHVFTIVLTVGASGITADAENPTFTIPAGFTAPDATYVANAGLVVADGDWSVIGGGTCLVESPVVGLTAAVGQVITVDVSTACTVGPGGIITLTYKGMSNTVGVTSVDVATNDVISYIPVKSISLAPNSATLPTITITDATPPTVVVTMDDNALNIGDTSLVTFTFSETPVEFTTLDVTVANGSIGAIDASNPLIQTAMYTPTNGITDATNIITVGTGWTDAALNTGVGDDSPNYSIDTIAPFVTVTMDDYILTVSETALVTFTFSEIPVGFTVADVTSFPNGVLSGFTSTLDPLVYTAIFTPNAEVNDNINIITVGIGWTDAALNTGVGDDSPNYTINTVVPTYLFGNSDNTITVVKQVINDSGGTASFTDFPLFINGNPVTSGQSIPFAPGTYTVTETTRGGYTRTFTGNCNANGVINHGGIGTQNSICTVVNNDIGIPTAPVVPPLIDVVKVPSPLFLVAGSGSVTYTYTLRNIGTVPVTNITMVGDTCSPVVFSSGDVNNDQKLDVNETWVYVCATTLSKTHTNIITATGWANGISIVDVASATVVVGVSGLPDTGTIPPLIHITKVPSPLTLSSGAEYVTYTKKVTNPGIVALSNVKVTDDKCSPINYISGDVNNNSKLDVTETWTYTCRVRLTKTTTNTAIATGVANGLIATDFALATVIVSTPTLPKTGFPLEEKYAFIKNIFKIFSLRY